MQSAVNAARPVHPSNAFIYAACSCDFYVANVQKPICIQYAKNENRVAEGGSVCVRVCMFACVLLAMTIRIKCRKLYFGSIYINTHVVNK